MQLEDLLVPTDGEPKSEEEREYRKILRDILIDEIDVCLKRNSAEIIRAATERAEFMLRAGKK